MYVNPFEIYAKKQDYYKNRQAFRDYKSEVDFTKMVLYPPNYYKLPSCTIKNEQIRKMLNISQSHKRV